MMSAQSVSGKHTSLRMYKNEALFIFLMLTLFAFVALAIVLRLDQSLHKHSRVSPANVYFRDLCRHQESARHDVACALNILELGPDSPQAAANTWTGLGLSCFNFDIKEPW